VKLKPEDTVTYIVDIQHSLKFGDFEIGCDGWRRLQENTIPPYHYIKTSAARSEIIWELYRES
jgi:hypothetical protein